MSKTGTTLAYTYNDDGIRMSKTINGVTTNYTLDNEKVVTETTGTQEISYTYDGNDELAFMTYDGAVLSPE